MRPAVSVLPAVERRGKCAASPLCPLMGPLSPFPQHSCCFVLFFFLPLFFFSLGVCKLVRQPNLVPHPASRPQVARLGQLVL